MEKRQLQVLGRKPKEQEWQVFILTDLESMQAYVGGYIEQIELPLGIDMWVHNEYLLHKNDVNIVLVRDKNNLPEIVFGNVFLASSDKDGNMVSLDNSQLNWIIENMETLDLSSLLNPVFRLNIERGILI